MKTRFRFWSAACGAALLTMTPGLRALHASSHMDAPLITLDPAANTTDVYAFRSDQVVTGGTNKFLTVALAVYPFEEPGIGPNNFRFDDNVVYAIHVATGTGLKSGRPTYTYDFRFKTGYKNLNTIAQAFLGQIATVGDSNQNLTQSYTVTKVTNATGKKEVLFSGNLVPPNNQGLVTNLYNQGSNGNSPAREGVATFADLDSYTQQTIYPLQSGSSATLSKGATLGYQVFAGQRSDGFYADIQALFDLAPGPSFTGGDKPHNSQAGFNLHTIVLNIPLAELGTNLQVAGVYATTSRPAIPVLRNMHPTLKTPEPIRTSGFVQVGRQGNPLFCEGLVSIVDKDRYNETPPTEDAMVFAKYALTPAIAPLVGATNSMQTTNRTDLEGIFIPDLIKTDLSTGPALLAGGTNSAAGAVADQPGFNRLGIFGGGPNAAGGPNPDVLISQIPGAGFTVGPTTGVQPGGWPNGRRFGDDVVDIAVLAVFSDLRNPAAPMPATAPADPGVDGIAHNDIGYNETFPYAPTPHNGRNETHQTNPQ